MAQTSNTQHTGGGPDNRPAGQMVRPQDGRVIAGVALAVSERLGLSVGAVRLIWFISAFFGGLGILLYLAGWLLIPEEDGERSIAEDFTGRLGDLTTWIGVALIAIATITLVSQVGWIRSDIAWAVALLAVGVLLYRGQLGTWEGSRSESSEGDEGSRQTGTARSVAAPDVIDSTDAVPPVRRPRQRSILGRLTVGTVFIVLGAMLILDTSDVIRPSFSHYMATAVAIVGLGLIVGSVFGRSRGLIVLGVFLIPIMLASSVVTAEFEGGWGDPVYRPATLEEVHGSYNLTGGQLELDLRQIDLAGGTVAIRGNVGFGQLTVLVPEGAGLVVTGHVGFGDMDVLGQRSDGIDLDRKVSSEGDGLFVLDLDVGFGQLEVREVSR